MDDWLNEHIKGKYLNSEMILGSFIWALKAATIAEKKIQKHFCNVCCFSYPHESPEKHLIVYKKKNHLILMLIL